MPEAVIFDMDGVLLDTERIALALLAECAAALGLPWSEAAGLGMVGRNERDSDLWLAEFFGPNYPVAPLRERFNQRYRLRIEAAPLPRKDGVDELLEWLASKRLPCAVATSTGEALARHKLAGAGLIGHFRAIVGGDQVACGKPAPDIYQAAARALGVAPAAALALEDSDAGVAAAQAAGCAVIMVPDVRPPAAATLATGLPVLPSLHAVRERLAAADALSSREIAKSARTPMLHSTPTLAASPEPPR